MVERRFLGVVEVDSGTLVVGDPSHLLARRDEGKDEMDYREVIDADSTPHSAGDRCC